NVVMTADQAMQATHITIKRDWNELQDYEFRTFIKYSFVCPADVVFVEDQKGVWHRIRTEEKNDSKPEIFFKGKQDMGTRGYVSQYTGLSLPPPDSTTPGQVGETILELMNINIQ